MVAARGCLLAFVLAAGFLAAVSPGALANGFQTTTEPTTITEPPVTEPQPDPIPTTVPRPDAAPQPAPKPKAPAPPAPPPPPPPPPARTRPIASPPATEAASPERPLAPQAARVAPQRRSERSTPRSQRPARSKPAVAKAPARRVKAKPRKPAPAVARAPVQSNPLPDDTLAVAMPLGGVRDDARSESTAVRQTALLFLAAIVGLGALLLCVSAVPASALPPGAIGRVVVRRRFDLAMAGFATLGAVALAFVAVYVPG